MVGSERSPKCQVPKGEGDWKFSLLSKGRVETTVENLEVVGDMEGTWKRGKFSYKIFSFGNG